MGWENRDYYRDRDTGGGNPLMWLLSGSVPLFTLFGIRVRAHASLLIVAVFILLFGWGPGSTVIERVHSTTLLFLVILLHEFGHCFGARWTGGSADQILMTPLGGLAFTMARRKPWPMFVTVACGPLVNVLICLLTGASLYLITGRFPFGPWMFGEVRPMDPGWLQVSSLLFWTYGWSYGLLLFNLLPIFPMDGGQLLQTILWKPMGYYRSMLLTLNIGLGGSVLMAMAGIASFGVAYGGLLLIFIAANCFMTCLQMRTMMKAEGQWAFQNEDAIDFDMGYHGEPRHKKLNPKLYKKVRKREAQERLEQEKIDAILAKVSAHGMHSLTWWEKRTLRKATARQRQRDLELSQNRSKF